MESAGKTAWIEPESDARRACGRECGGVRWRGDCRGAPFVFLILRPSCALTIGQR